MPWHCTAHGQWVLGGLVGFLGTYLGGRGGDGGGTAVDISLFPGFQGHLVWKRGVWEEDFLSAQGVMVPGWMEGERGMVSIR